MDDYFDFDRKKEIWRKLSFWRYTVNLNKPIRLQDLLNSVRSRAEKKDTGIFSLFCFVFVCLFVCSFFLWQYLSMAISNSWTAHAQYELSRVKLAHTRSRSRYVQYPRRLYKVVTLSSGVWRQIADLKQLPVSYKTKKAVHSIASKFIQIFERLVEPRPIKWLQKPSAKTQAFALA